VPYEERQLAVLDFARGALDVLSATMAELAVRIGERLKALGA